ncbi:LLM class flavin-dependent oxidoreductase (plasmid) [Rhizobium rhizogenes]|nr:MULTISPECIES: LLM class flavin-dependent oxidoreductase [Rhizobium/Agrobacterium group]NTA84614.1 LLM class flavin-dependent oxidoreductase [Agrobacterium tumefaciens]NTE95038.1 LLM class flavin-dependent oxidoreductase [Agrobacterium tumefaciens]NTF53120.1 LLM class flavin-dependent oxidoreductase [Rhizobium rhizogenes]NTH81391.1 LLM class flavin-dependent oxidoreductase [Rhizobium rhizogenes]NTH87368.1 LLM class flavin-dependent oxidoreductase [Rhizobium rhizogenes]
MLMGVRQVFGLGLMISDPITTADLVTVARTAEKAGFTTLTIGGRETILDPTTILAALAARTEQIGLVAAVNVDTALPYDFARRLASLDHLSSGRAGWKPYSTADEPDEARIAEFVHAVSHLLDSWDDDAAVYDKESGIYVDISKVHRLDHIGEYYRVAGPLDIPRAPQGRPVLVQEVLAADLAEGAWPTADIIEIVPVPGQSTNKPLAPRAEGNTTLLSIVADTGDLASMHALLNDGDVDGATVRVAPRIDAVARAARDIGLWSKPRGSNLRDTLGLSRPESLFALRRNGVSA